VTADAAIVRLREHPRDTQAWEVVYRSVQKVLLAYVSSLILTFRVGSSEEAEDLVHEVLIAFFERWPVIREKIEGFEGTLWYLKRSCRNLLVDRYRHSRSADQMIDYLSVQFSTAFGSEAALYRGLFINEILDALPKECRNLLRRYIEEDLSPADLADEEGASHAAFYSRWYRCIQRARK